MTESVPPTGLPLALVAGDRSDELGWLVRLLDSAGYATLKTRSGRHALERARAAEPDVIIAAADLPDMPGLALCRALAEDPRVTASTPIFLNLAHAASREERLAALGAGAWECIAPPHDAQEILLKIGIYSRAKRDADGARAQGQLDPATGLYNRHGLARRARELGALAFRVHGPLACVVLVLDVELATGGPGSEPDMDTEAATRTTRRCVEALTSAARRSDVVGRLSPSEFAVLMPGTDARGARQLAERLAALLRARATPPGHARDGAPALRVRCGYEAIANMGYTPIEPVALLVRAAAALRTGKADAGEWVWRFDSGVAAGSPAGASDASSTDSLGALS